jgi:predicted metal-dependent hydrolase
MNGVMHLQGRPVRYRVRASNRARRLSLRMRERDSVEIVVPPFLVGVNPERVLREMETWILRTIDRMQRQERSAPLQPVGEGTAITFMGNRLTVRVEETDRKRAAVHLRGEELTVLRPRGGTTDIPRILRLWCLAQAKTAIPRRVRELNGRWNLPCAGVTVRNQKTRWGSCSRRGTLSLNWRLVLLPSSVMDYLILHELAHLKEMNHSPRFWKVVASLCPGYREEERWLRKHGRSVLL